MKSQNIYRVFIFSAITLILSLLFFQCATSKTKISTAKNEKITAADIKNMVQDKDFVFIADRVNPLRGRSRFLTSEYDVTLKNDSLVSYLPFFGRAYQAPINPSEGGIQFTSTNFSYHLSSGKNKNWEITIMPKDYQQVQQFFFSIFDNGSATLNVTNTNRDPISFNGHIEKIKK